MKLFYTCFLVCIFFTINAQTEIFSPSVISTGGGNLEAENYNLSFTIGELAIETFFQTDIILSQGFQQESYQLEEVANSSINNFRVSVFPSLVQDVLNISFDKVDSTVDIYVKDIKGSLIYNRLNCSTNEEQRINLNQFSQGVYFIDLVLKNESRIVYKIQKIN